VDCRMTSPPYWGLRDYGHEGQMGLEETPEAYTENMIAVFREVRRVLKTTGTLWLNLGDSYTSGGRATRDADDKLDARGMDTRPMTPVGLKPKDLVGIPWRVAFALQADGWYLRSDIIWAKPNPMPESVTDRPTKAHEYMFLLSKSDRYSYDAEAVKEDAVSANAHDFTGQGYSAPGQTPNTGNRGRSGNKDRKQRPSSDALNIGAQAGSIPWEGFRRNRRTVWSIASEPFKDAHFAVMPRALVAPCVLAGCPKGGTILDPFTGSGTVGIVALNHNRRFVGIELNPVYAEMARKRMAAIPEPLPFEDAV
jgi:DNA modification methylase